ncbi:MAG: hypothetical protein FWF41_09080, partial [Betaproteobacteria bacterium]|nr:hypothetical protein [Betaproteobacteria bacterium]
PKAPEGMKPKAPEGMKPKAPEGMKPKAPEGMKPKAPEGMKPEAPEDMKPKAPEGMKPEAPEGMKPEAPEGMKPEALAELTNMLEDATGIEDLRDKTKKVLSMARQSGDVAAFNNLKAKAEGMAAFMTGDDHGKC